MLTATKHINQYLNKTASAAPLAVFRVLFGGMMLLSIIRFWTNGWIDKLYIQPEFFFSYAGFEWVKPFGLATYGLFAICALAALMVMLGFKYRLAIISFFLSFTYIELMDKTTYLNHYYFISLVAFLLIWLPANATFSLDTQFNRKRAYTSIPLWTVDSIKLLLAIVYFYAGLAKLNSDWLMEAMPLKIWLPSHAQLPIIGPLLNKNWMHFAMSWGGAFYDLSIPFFLLYKRTRILAFVAVVFFHVFTRILFPIGMFPYIMILSTLIFFSPRFHEQLLARLRRLFRSDECQKEKSLVYNYTGFRKIGMAFFVLFFAIQLIFPFRHCANQGELFWTEEGYRFSWRVMLMEKAGYVQFKVRNPENGQRIYIQNDEYLSAFQEKQMATQPDFILQFARHLAKIYELKGIAKPEVYVDSYVALNGRRSQAYIRPDVNLAQIPFSTKRINLLLPFKDEIKGI